MRKEWTIKEFIEWLQKETIGKEDYKIGYIDISGSPMDEHVYFNDEHKTMRLE